MEENIFIKELLFVTSKKFGDLFAKYTKNKLQANPPDNVHYDMLKNKRIEVKSARAIKKSKDSSYLNSLIHSKQLVSVNTEEKFDCIIQQIQPANFDELHFYICFQEGIYYYSLSSNNIVIKQYLKYSNKQHYNNTGEGQFHITRKNLDIVNKDLLKKIIPYSELYSFIKDYSK